MLVVAAIIAAVLVSRSGGAGSSNAGPGGGRGAAAVSTGAAVPRPARDPSLTVSVTPGATGRPIPAGFLGFSFEFQAVRAYTGSDPEHINPVLVQLIRNLTPGQAPVLRIGGDSTDVSYVPAPGVRPPAFVTYPLGPGWLTTTAALARRLRARLIMGLNLTANEPALDAAEARAYVRAFGNSIEALEIGNEPNVYSKVNVYHTVFGVPVAARRYGYGYPAYGRQFKAIAAVTPPLPLAGPALAIGPTPGPGSWVGSISTFLARDRRVATMTVHRYPLRNCYVPPSSPQYPSIPHLLSNYASAGLAASLRRWIRIARAQHRQLRVDELNSVACRGKSGVSDTFASALWATDALFSLARAGVGGIDMHTLPNSAYELFSFADRHGRWTGSVRPVYYGLQLFAQAAPAGARIVPLHARGHAPGLSTWATRDRGGATRVVLINKSTTRDRTVRIRVPGAARAGIERMLAPSAAARTGVTLGGATYGASTASGRLPARHDPTVIAHRGAVTVAVPRASAALLTFPAGA